MKQFRYEFALVLLVCHLLSTASCDDKVSRRSCLLNREETSLIQTKKAVELGIERSAKASQTDKEENKEARSKASAKGAETDNEDNEAMQPSPLEPGMNSVAPDLTVDLAGAGTVASQIVQSTSSAPLTSPPRQMATVNLALMALNVPGDFVETGVFRGGTSVLMAKVLQQFDPRRTLWAADSFVGLPSENPLETAREQQVPESVTPAAATRRMGAIQGNVGDYGSSRQVFEDNLAAHGLNKLSPPIQVLQGFFSQTLPTAPIGQISFLRLDGDLYVSTMDALNNLYGRVSPGGLIYVDDYGYYVGCKHAVDDFRQQHGIQDPVYPIYECPTCAYTALWWRKSS